MNEKKGFEDALHDLDSAAAGAGDGPAEGRPAEADAASHPTVPALRARFGAAILHHSVVAGDEHIVRVALEKAYEIVQWLRDDAVQRYDYLKDVTAIDWGGGRPLELVYELWSIRNARGLRLKAAVPLDALAADSIASLYATADWLERETYDMFGIVFREHPDLRRILMPENYAEGYPLRKDFPLRGRFTRAEQTRRSLAFDLADYYNEQELSVVEDVARQRDAQRQAEGAP